MTRRKAPGSRPTAIPSPDRTGSAMADRIVLLTRGDQSRAGRIIASFAERTGLARQDVDGGASFPLKAGDHRVEVVQTLTDIDPEWTEHLALGDPQSPPAAA